MNAELICWRSDSGSADVRQHFLMNIGCFSVFLVGWMSHYCLFICLLMFCWAPLFIQSHLRFNHRRNSVVFLFSSAIVTNGQMWCRRPLV